MRKGGGKAKGASFERDVCKSLSLWITGGKQEDVFWRSAMSGGRATVALAKGKRLASQAGDITCIHPAGEAFSKQYFCECKFYADLDYAGLLTTKGKLVSFWHEARWQAKKYEKLPFLIAKQNRQPTTVCLTSTGTVNLCLNVNNSVLWAPQLDMFIFNAETVFLDHFRLLSEVK